MPRELDFFFYIGSTYTYLSVNRVEEIAAREGVALRWRPFHVRAIMIEQNNRPFIGKPVKLRYMWRDVERRAQRYGIPFKSIPDYPVDPEGLANRVAVLASLEGWCPEYTKATYRAWFLENKAPGSLEHGSIHSFAARKGPGFNHCAGRQRGNSRALRFGNRTCEAAWNLRRADFHVGAGDLLGRRSVRGRDRVGQVAPLGAQESGINGHRAVRRGY